MIKISDEQAAKLGIASFEELEAKLAGVAKTKVDLGAFEARLSTIEANALTLASRIDGLPRIDTAALVKDAVTQASAQSEVIAAKAVSGAIARAGTQGLAPNQPKTEGNGTESKPAADDYQAQWDASADIRNEFVGGFKSFESYMIAEKRGQTNNPARA